MHLVLLRHGIAIDRLADACPPDPDRWLTEQGTRRTRAAVAGLAALDVRPRLVLSSPYRRARETAELARSGLCVAAPVRGVAHFEPGGDPALAARSLVAAAGSCADVLVAGHAPQLDRLLAWLVGAPRPFTALKKAGAARLDVRDPRPGGASLVGLATARGLRALGRSAP